MKFKKLFSKRAIELSVFFGLLCAVFMSFSHFNAACDDLRSNVLRLHIIANSNSDADQELKLKIRDKILEQTSYVFNGQITLEEAVTSVELSLDEFERIANEVIAENGFDYSAKAEVGECYFETREYEDFTLPAGNYTSLIVRLGEAKGKNWWCVVFPAVCVPAATDASLSDSTSEESAEIAECSQRYVMRFKAVEIYEELKKIINE